MAIGDEDLLLTLTSAPLSKGDSVFTNLCQSVLYRFLVLEFILSMVQFYTLLRIHFGSFDLYVPCCRNYWGQRWNSIWFVNSSVRCLFRIFNGLVIQRFQRELYWIGEITWMMKREFIGLFRIFHKQLMNCNLWRFLLLNYYMNSGYAGV